MIGLLLVGAAFVNPIDFTAATDDERATSSAGPQTLAKLGMVAVAATLMMVLLTWSLVFGATSHLDWIRGVVVVLVSGLVEETILESFPLIVTMSWITALLTPSLATPDTSPHYAPS